MNTNNTKPKKATMQDEADALFDLQMRISEKTKGSDRTGFVLFLAFLFLFGALILILPDKTFSEQENRRLQTFPKLQSDFNGSFIERVRAGKFLDKYLSGDFSEDISDYYADQFPARDFFVGLKGVAEIAMLKGENNDVVLGSGDVLLTRMDDANAENAVKNFRAAAAFADRMTEKQIPVTFAAAGRVIDVMQARLPALFPVDTVNVPWNALAEAVGAESGAIRYLDLCTPLRTRAENGEYVMYRTDHHWTTLGAYYAYRELLESWDMEPLPLDAFEIELVSDAFYGTAWRNAGMKWVQPDEMQFFRFAGDMDYTMTVHDNNTVYEGFYDRSYLDVTDKYSAFLSGNRAYITIEKNGAENRERLLLVKDSFGHSIAPFLAYHFDLEIIDLRYYKTSVAALVEETGCSRVLILNNMESLTSAATLGMLGME